MTGREQTPAYRCNCGATFPSHLARTAHAGGCKAMQEGRDRTVHLPPLDPMLCMSCGEEWPCRAAQGQCPAGNGPQCCGFISDCRRALGLTDDASLRPTAASAEVTVPRPLCERHGLPGCAVCGSDDASGQTPDAGRG